VSWQDADNPQTNASIISEGSFSCDSNNIPIIDPRTLEVRKGGDQLGINHSYREKPNLNSEKTTPIRNINTLIDATISELSMGGSANTHEGLENNSIESTLPQWTFAVYMDGDNDIEAGAINDFEEMARIGSSLNLQIIVLLDRVSGGDNSHGDWTDTRMFYITPESEPEASDNLPSWTPTERNMGNPNTLVEFGKYVLDHFYSYNYAFILWDHGAGLDGVCVDASSSADSLTPAELHTAFSEITAHRYGNKIELVAFDACLMGMSEVYYALKDYVDVVVGSEYDVPGDGYPYSCFAGQDPIDGILNHLDANTLMTPKQLGTTIVNDYIQSYHYGSQGTNWNVNLGSFNEPEVSGSTFLQKFNDFAMELIEAHNTYGTQIEDRRTAIPTDEGDIGVIDLIRFADRITEIEDDSFLMKAATYLSNYLKSASVRNAYGETRGLGHGGLSIYYPNQKEGQSIRADYASFALSIDSYWDEFLHTFNDEYTSDTIAPYTGIGYSGYPGENGWWKGPVSFDLYPTDSGGSGLLFTRYRIDEDAAWQKYVGTLQITSQGKHPIDYYSVDRNGNVESIKNWAVNIDSVNPTSLSILINNGEGATISTSVTLSLSAYDATSGLTPPESQGKMCFSNTPTDPNSWTSWETYATLKSWTLTPGDGLKTVGFKVKDEAGNIADFVTSTIIFKAIWTGMAIPQDDNEFNFNTISTPYGVGYHIDSSGYLDNYLFDMMGYCKYNFKVQQDGSITVKGFFKQIDTFGTLSKDRTQLKIYILDSATLSILASSKVLTDQNPINTWIEAEKTITGLSPGSLVKMGVGRPDSWYKDWKLVAEWACVRAIDPNYYGTTVPPWHQFHFTTPTAEYPAYKIDTVGITGDYGFDMMGYSEQYFAVQGGWGGTGGTITVSGSFLQFDTGFGGYPLEGRRMLQIYALDPIDLHIISQASVLDYQDDINTWYQVTEFTLGGLNSYAGDYVRIGIGRSDAWYTDWSLTASWSWKSVDQVIKSPSTSCPDSSITGTTNNGWYVSKVEVTLTALSQSVTSTADGQPASPQTYGSVIYYCLDDGAWEIYKKPIKNLKDGVHRIDYYAVDENGIGSNLQTLILMIDTSGPTRPGIPSWIPGDETDGVFELTWAPSSDPLSGVQSYILQQQKDDGKWVTIASDIEETAFSIGSGAPLTPGTYCYRVCAVDVAGNVGHWANAGSVIVPV